MALEIEALSFVVLENFKPGRNSVSCSPPPHPLHLFLAESHVFASDEYCLISYRVGAWHYRIFADFLNSGFKMSSKIEGKAKVTACSWNDINGRITPESLYSTAKNSCFTALKNFDQKIREKKDLIGDFRYLEVFIWKDSRIVRPKVWTKNRRV